MKYLLFILILMFVSSVAFASVEKPNNETKKQKQTIEEVEIVPENNATNYSDLVTTVEATIEVNQVIDFARCKISDGVFRARGNCQQVLDAYARWLSMQKE